MKPFSLFRGAANGSSGSLCVLGEIIHDVEANSFDTWLKNMRDALAIHARCCVSALTFPISDSHVSVYCYECQETQ